MFFCTVLCDDILYKMLFISWLSHIWPEFNTLVSVSTPYCICYIVLVLDWFTANMKRDKVQEWWITYVHKHSFPSPYISSTWHLTDDHTLVFTAHHVMLITRILYIYMYTMVLYAALIICMHVPRSLCWSFVIMQLPTLYWVKDTRSDALHNVLRMVLIKLWFS